MKRIKDFLAALIISFSFFTAIPMPFVKWEKERMRYIPFFLPLIGFVIGSVMYLLYSKVLLELDLSRFLTAVIIVVGYIVITGGLHIDALMDTADAHFSRRPRERKLEIMKDSNVGAFAVCAFVCFIILKVAVINELVFKKDFGIWLIIVPTFSRTLQSLMLVTSKFATNEGLAKMYDGVLDLKTKFMTGFIFIALSVVLLIFHIELLPFYIMGIIYYVYYKYIFCYRQFGGITGDLIGAFLEVVELILFGTILVLVLL